MANFTTNQLLQQVAFLDMDKPQRNAFCTPELHQFCRTFGVDTDGEREEDLIARIETLIADADADGAHLSMYDHEVNWAQQRYITERCGEDDTLEIMLCKFPKLATVEFDVREIEHHLATLLNVMINVGSHRLALATWKLWTSSDLHLRGFKQIVSTQTVAMVSSITAVLDT